MEIAGPKLLREIVENFSDELVKKLPFSWNKEIPIKIMSYDYKPASEILFKYRKLGEYFYYNELSQILGGLGFEEDSHNLRINPERVKRISYFPSGIMEYLYQFKLFLLYGSNGNLKRFEEFNYNVFKLLKKEEKVLEKMKIEDLIRNVENKSVYYWVANENTIFMEPYLTLNCIQNNMIKKIEKLVIHELARFQLYDTERYKIFRNESPKKDVLLSEFKSKNLMINVLEEAFARKATNYLLNGKIEITEKLTEEIKDIINKSFLENKNVLKILKNSERIDRGVIDELLYEARFV
ncbi:MAG: hypothetical protein QW412_02665 [Candidatus Aenigmatarchaeota archaeon]